MSDIQVDEFLSPHAGVVEHPKQGIVSSAKRIANVDRGEDALDFLVIKILGRPVGLALERNTQHGLAVAQMAWVDHPEVLEERMDRR